MYSQRQLYTIATFGTVRMPKMVLHSGCFGCGKTFSIMAGLGKWCLDLHRQGIDGLTIVLLGKTQASIKKNMCNVLAKLYGKDFKYDMSTKSGTVKDATLFNQNLYIIGLSDASSETKFRGLSNIMGIVHDEAVLCTQEQFDFMMGRLRGEIDPRIPEEYLQHWYIGSTNPDTPNHFLLSYCKMGILKMVKWYMRDACWDGAEEYFDRLKLIYRNNPAFYNRYLLGQWTSADKMVYCMFQPKNHILDSEEMLIDYKKFKRNFIAVDYGSDHPTAILLISLNYQNCYIVSREYKLTNTAPSDIALQVSRVIDFINGEGSYCAAVYVDPSAKALKDELVKRGIEYKNAMNSHVDGIGCIQTRLALNQLFILSRCENLINEMYSYRYKENNANTGKDDVVKIDDDFVDALRYGVYTDSVIGGG